MAKKRKYHRYELKQGKKVVYRGITKDPESRESQHKNKGKRFSHIHKIGPGVTKKTAEKWEEQSLKTYRKSHKGRNPRYNKTDK